MKKRHNVASIFKNEWLAAKEVCISVLVKKKKIKE